MKTVGEKIKQLRNALDMTQKELADELGVSVQMLGRYERGKANLKLPVVTKMATLFDVSADYLLGVYSNTHANEILDNNTYKSYYGIYLDSRNNYMVDSKADYYWIYACGQQIGGETEFVGWHDEEEKIERHRLCAVDPDKAIEECTNMHGKPMVVNSPEEVAAFLTYGGQAIIKKELCEKYMPWYLEDFLVYKSE